MTPIFIISFNRPSMLRQLIGRLEKFRVEEGIVVVDNASTYPPLLDYYSALPYPVIRLNTNYGHTVMGYLWTDQAFRKRYRLDSCHYVYSDCDVRPVNDCPDDFMDVFARLLDKYPDTEKVGFGLAIDDLPDHSDLKKFKDVDEGWRGIWLRQESYWTKQLEPGVFAAPIDTTFALRRAGTTPGLGEKAIRTGYPRLAQHLPWYLDSDNLDAEYQYYLEHVIPTSGVTSGLQKRRWRQGSQVSRSSA